MICTIKVSSIVIEANDLNAQHVYYAFEKADKVGWDISPGELLEWVAALEKSVTVLAGADDEKRKEFI